MADETRSAATERSKAASTLRLYISSFSMPMQGPLSGAMTWVSREDAMRAVETLEQLAGSSDGHGTTLPGATPSSRPIPSKPRAAS